MALQYRTIRAAGSALLIAVSFGVGGLTGVGSALAVDPAMVTVDGVLDGSAGEPLAGVQLVVEELESPAGALAGFPVTTGVDGGFSVSLYPWGSATEPATLTIRTAPDQEVSIDDGSCVRTWAVEVLDERAIALADGAPEPLAVKAATTLRAESCAATATPPPDASAGASDDPGAEPSDPVTEPSDPGTEPSSGVDAGGPLTGGVLGATGTPGLTPPPTDAVPLRQVTSDRSGATLTLGFVIGLIAAGLRLAPRRGARRR
ncbi:MAG: hypothetical protein QOF49_1883 [Chloroflexota bacterium]|nr:hypothetical protein [Chloroflexota bacterium]